MGESAKAELSVSNGKSERKKLKKLRKKGLGKEGKGSTAKHAAITGKSEKSTRVLSAQKVKSAFTQASFLPNTEDFNDDSNSPQKHPPKLELKREEVRAFENSSSETVTEKKKEKKIGPDGVRRPSVPKPNKKQRMKRRLAKLEAGLIDNSRADDPKQRAAEGKPSADTEMGTKVERKAGIKENTQSPDKASEKKRQKRKSAGAVLQANEAALDKGAESAEPTSTMETDASTKKKKKKRRLTSENGQKAANGSNVSTPAKKTKSDKSSEDDGEAGIDSDVKPSTADGEAADKYKEILERLSTVQADPEARQVLADEVSAGRIEEADVMTIMQRWRQQKRKRARNERKEKVVEMEGSLDDVKRVVNDLVRRNKLKPWEAGDIIKRWKNRERRRVDRQISKQTNKACFHCRKQGHVLADCPNRGEEEHAVGNVAVTQGDGICFKCGSTEHNIYKCPRKHVKGFPFASCFICGQQGHLSRDCEQNAHGIYPDGGSCNVCGSTKHLKRDCPELAAQKQKQDERKVKVRVMTAMSSADAEDVLDDEMPKDDLETKPKKKKIVKF